MFLGAGGVVAGEGGDVFGGGDAEVGGLDSVGQSIGCSDIWYDLTAGHFRPKPLSGSDKTKP